MSAFDIFVVGLVAAYAVFLGLAWLGFRRRDRIARGRYELLRLKDSLRWDAEMGRIAKNDVFFVILTAAVEPIAWNLDRITMYATWRWFRKVNAQNVDVSGDLSWNPAPPTDVTRTYARESFRIFAESVGAFRLLGVLLTALFCLRDKIKVRTEFARFFSEAFLTPSRLQALLHVAT